jgi:hypothetical protein
VKFTVPKKFIAIIFEVHSKDGFVSPVSPPPKAALFTMQSNCIFLESIALINCIMLCYLLISNYLQINIFLLGYYFSHFYCAKLEFYLEVTYNSMF